MDPTGDDPTGAESLADCLFAAMIAKFGTDAQGMVRFGKNDIYMAVAIVLARIEIETMDLRFAKVRAMVARAVGNQIAHNIALILAENALPRPPARDR